VKATPTVFVVDDDPAMRQSLRWLIESVGLAVEDFDSAEAFLRRYHDDDPGCLVLDVRMPGTSGLELQELLTGHGVQIPVIVVTGYADVNMAVRAMKAGAVEFIEKPFNDQVLLDRIQAAIEKDSAGRSRKTQRSAIEKRLNLLTDREMQVLRRVVAGMSNKEIAANLSVSDKTIEVHRSHIMRKMQAKNVADLVRLVVTARPDLSGLRAPV